MPNATQIQCCLNFSDSSCGWFGLSLKPNLAEKNALVTLHCVISM